MRKTRFFAAFLAAVILVTGLGSYSTLGSEGDAGTDMLWEWVVPPRYAHVNSFANGFAVVSYGEPVILPNGELADFPLLGLIDRSGNLVVPMEFAWLGVDDGVLKAMDTTSYGGQRLWIVGAGGNLTLYHPDPNRFDWAWDLFIPNSFFCRDEDNIKDRTTGEVLIPSRGRYTSFFPFSPGFARVHVVGSGAGLIDANNNVIIPFEYDYIAPFIDFQLRSANETPPWEAISGNSVTRGIHRDGKWGLVNNRGEIVVNLIYDVEHYHGWATGFADFHNGIAPVLQNGRWGVIDVWGNIIVPIEFQAASTRSGLAVVRNDDGLHGAFDNTGRLVVPFDNHTIFGFNSDMITITRDGKAGFVNMDGDLVIENTFDDTRGFYGDFAAVSRNGKWGFINRSGDVVVPIIYDNVWNFTEGIAAVELGGLWGFMRPLSGANQHVIPLVNTNMNDTRFINLQIDNPMANNNAILTQIDEENDEIVPIIEEDRTLVPIRFISESFGIDVDWDGYEQRVDIISDDTTIALFINSTQTYVNGEAVYIDVAPIIRNGRTFVPIRFISEIMGFDVAWRGEDRVVTIQQN